MIIINQYFESAVKIATAAISSQANCDIWNEEFPKKVADLVKNVADALQETDTKSPSKAIARTGNLPSGF